MAHTRHTNASICHLLISSSQFYIKFAHHYRSIVRFAVGLKSLVYAVILVAAMGALMANAQGGFIGTLLGLIHIEGTLYCTVNGKIGDLGQATPVFPSTL